MGLLDCSTSHKWQRSIWQLQPGPLPLTIVAQNPLMELCFLHLQCIKQWPAHDTSPSYICSCMLQYNFTNNFPSSCSCCTASVLDVGTRTIWGPHMGRLMAPKSKECDGIMDDVSYWSAQIIVHVEFVKTNIFTTWFAWIAWKFHLHMLMSSHSNICKDVFFRIKRELFTGKW